MERILRTIAVMTLVICTVACGKEPTTTNANSSADPVAADKIKPEAAAEVKATATDAKPLDIADKVKPAPKVIIPASTILHVALLDSVSSDKSHPGDQFLASLTQPVAVEGKTVLAKGTKVQGRVVDANESGRVKGRASLELTLTQLMRDGTKPIELSTKPYTAVAEKTTKRDAEVIGGGAGIGAAIGALAGGGKGAAIGAAVGGGAGTGAVLGTKGKEIHFAPEHPLSFTLTSSIEM